MMALCFGSLLSYSQLVFYFMVTSAQVHNDVHNIVASSRDDLLSLFGVDSVDSVPDYEVAPIHHDKTRRDITDAKHYRLSAFQKDFHLELRPTYDVVSPTLVVMRKTSDSQWEKDLYTPEGQFYQGHVMSDPNSHVAVREMMEDGELSGSIVMDNYMYKVHPIPDHVASRMSIKQRGYHVITRRRLDHINKGFYPEPIKVFLEQNDEYLILKEHRVRREVTPKYIEAMMTMDKLSCDYYGNATMDFVLAVANMVNRLYNDKSLELDVTWCLTKVFLIQAYEEGLDVKKHKIDSAVRYLKRFAGWARVKNTPAGEVEHFDNGVLLSRDICGLKDCSLGGVAFSGVPCSTTLGYTINNAIGLDAAFYVAHEMGHNFGLTHDSGDCEKGYMMNAGQAHGPKAFQWSPCSSKQMKQIFGQYTCYNNKPPSKITLPVIPPGHKYDADKQCKLMYGDGYSLCPVTRGNCDLLFCYKHTGCSSSGAPPVDGTPCGHRKWCIGAHCVDIGSSIPPAINGAWGEWGAYTSCSRTCGGGVQHRTRECNNPSPQNHGKYCPGSSIGEWRICNDKDCPPGTPSYRKYQCLSIKRGRGLEYTDYYGGSSCTLLCRRSNVVRSEGRVADGTRYTDEPHHLDICISGSRVDVGCDNVIHSKSIVDRCMKCLGNGSTCVPVKGVYTKQWRSWGAAKADPIIVIPAGSTRFYIKENSKTWNLLNMKLFPAKSNPLIFPDRPSNSTRSAAGTLIRYNIHNSDLDFAESMAFIGPTTKALVAMYVYVGFQPNAGYKYSFYKPGKAPDTALIWKTVLLGPCTTTCAGGVRAQRVTCHRQDDQSQVAGIHCKNSTRPKDVVPCNEQPCPGRWEAELWGPCSRKCGGGSKTRLVPCVEQVTATKYRQIEDSKCNISSRPHQKEVCNYVDCPPVWVIGEWSACFPSDSRFITTRRVGCRNKLANGTIVPRNMSICSELTNDVPESEKECTIPTGTTPTGTTPTGTTPTGTGSIQPTSRSSTTEIRTIIAVHARSTGESSKSWMYGVITVALVVVAAIIVLFVLYRFGKLNCKCRKQNEPKVDHREVEALNVTKV